MEFDALQARLAPASWGSEGRERVWGVSGERSSGERGRELRDHLTPVTGGRAETLHLGDMSSVYHDKVGFLESNRSSSL